MAGKRRAGMAGHTTTARTTEDFPREHHHNRGDRKMAVDRGGAQISDDMLAARDAVRTGEISHAEYKKATEGYHQELNVLFAANRADQDARHPEWAEREAG